MKRSVLVLAILAIAVLSSTVVAASDTWTRVPTGTDGWLLSVDFVGSQGWILAYSGAVLKTEDAGRSWHEVSNLPSSGAYDVDFVNAEDGWAATSGGIYRTTDGGAHWHASVQLPLNFHGASSLSFVSKTTGWAKIDRWNGTTAVVKTTDGGLTWTEQFTGANVTSVFFLNAKQGWAVGDHGVVVITRDGGRTWNSGTTPGGNADNLSDATFLNPHLGWASGSRGGVGGIVIKTTDGGRTWTYSLEGPMRYSHYFQVLFSNKREGFAVGEALPDSSGGVGITGVDTIAKVYQTTNGGITWNDISPSSHDPLFAGAFGIGQFWAAGYNGVLWSLPLRR